MGRTRSFDEAEVISRAAEVFVRTGYEGSSIDDLVRALGLHRGSIYQAFGSKRGLFVAALRRCVEQQLSGVLSSARVGRTVDVDVLVADPVLDLVLVAGMELAARDSEVAELVGAAREQLDAAVPRKDGSATVLGRRFLARAGCGSPSDAVTTTTSSTSPVSNSELVDWDNELVDQDKKRRVS